MRNKLMILSALLTWLGQAQAAPAVQPTLTPEESKLIKNTFGCVVTKGDCIVDLSLGGNDDDFIAAARILYYKHVRLVPKVCASACVVGLDRILLQARWDANDPIRRVGRENIRDAVCYIPQTRLLVHQAYILKDPSRQPLLDRNGDIRPDDDNVVYVPNGFRNTDLVAAVEALKPLPRTRNLNRNKMIPHAVVKTILPACEERPEFQAKQ